MFLLLQNNRHNVIVSLLTSGYESFYFCVLLLLFISKMSLISTDSYTLFFLLQCITMICISLVSLSLLLSPNFITL